MAIGEESLAVVAISLTKGGCQECGADEANVAALRSWQP